MVVIELLFRYDDPGNWNVAVISVEVKDGFQNSDDGNGSNQVD